MKAALFVSVDGPKGTGKTTVLEAVTKVLRGENRKVIRFCEKKLDPYRGDTMVLVNRLARHPDPALEREVCERLADSRRWISLNRLARQASDSILLIDRWYPSDAAFRRTIPFADILRLNSERKVRVPDLHIGLVTRPDISWGRAAARPRGLGSTLIHSLEEHIACTEAFERTAQAQGWCLCRNEGTVDDAAARIVAEIHALI